MRRLLRPLLWATAVVLGSLGVAFIHDGFVQRFSGEPSLFVGTAAVLTAAAIYWHKLRPGVSR